MPHSTSIIRATISCLVLFFLTGCLAPPKRHGWQITREDAVQLQGAGAWPQLSTNDYIRVPDSKRQDAVALLQKHSFVQLDMPQLSTFAPSLAGGTGQAYLVRGAAYSSHPAFTIVRWDVTTGRLLVLQFTYDGEMMMPFAGLQNRTRSWYSCLTRRSIFIQKRCLVEIGFFAVEIGRRWIHDDVV